jgi:hypothetical protein
MEAPFILVSTYTLKEGVLEDYRDWTKGLSKFVEANEPRLIAFNVYANDAGTEVTGIQFHPDAASMAAHLDVVGEYIKDVFGDFLESTTMMLVCGEGEAARAMMERLSPPGTALTAMPQHLAGFTRSAAAP